MYAADRVDSDKEESVRRMGSEEAMHLGDVDNDDCRLAVLAEASSKAPSLELSVKLTPSCTLV